MPRRSEIIQRANDEFNILNDAFRRDHAEVMRQREASLQTVAEVQSAFVTHRNAVAEAERTFQGTQETLARTLADAETAALQQQFDDDTVALNAWKDGDHDADVARADAITAADQKRDDALAAAGLVPPPDVKREAEATRQQEIRVAERAHSTALERNFRQHEKAVAANREAAITAIEKARGAQQAGVATASAARDRAIAQADAALSAAIDATPIAHAIAEAFRARLDQLERDFETNKAALFARLQRDLQDAEPDSPV